MEEYTRIQSHSKITLPIFRIQSKITEHVRKREKNVTHSKEKRANCEMTQTLKLADKDFKVGIIIVLYEMDKML